MNTQVTETEFIDAFKALRPENFSYQGLQALYAYLEELEADTGTPLEMDVIAICCDFQEFENWAEFKENYDLDLQVKNPCCDVCIPYWNNKRLENLRDYTTVIPISEKFTSMDINGIMSSNKEAFIIQVF